MPILRKLFFFKSTLFPGILKESSRFKGEPPTGGFPLIFKLKDDSALDEVGTPYGGVPPSDPRDSGHLCPQAGGGGKGGGGATLVIKGEDPFGGLLPF